MFRSVCQVRDIRPLRTLPEMTVMSIFRYNPKNAKILAATHPG